jgi:hypothetical protein
MRFRVMHKVDAKMESGERPSDEIIQKMGRLVGQAIKDGILHDGAGLHRSAQRVRLVFEGDRREIVRGPFSGSNELIAGFAMVKAQSQDHAIELATTLARAAGEREIEIGPVVEGWDLHGGTRPANAPLRFLLLRKGEAAFEAGAATPPAVATVLDQWKRDDVLVSAAALAPSSSGARLRVSNGKRIWFDGPFTESKELVAGYAILEMPTMAVVKEFAEEYAKILGDNEIDVRVVA